MIPIARIYIHIIREGKPGNRPDAFYRMDAHTFGMNGSYDKQLVAEGPVVRENVPPEFLYKNTSEWLRNFIGE